MASHEGGQSRPAKQRDEVDEVAEEERQPTSPSVTRS